MCCDRYGNIDTLTWCMCSAMNPPEDGYYFVTREGWSVPYVGILIFKDNMWIDALDHPANDVISWTSLPEPFTGV